MSGFANDYLEGYDLTVILEARGLTRTFTAADQTVRALTNVSFDVEQGEFIVIIGASGSGKSVLLHCLGGIDRPTSGAIVIAGQDLTGLSERNLTVFRREQIGFVFQYLNLIPSLSVYENITLPFIVSGRIGKEQQERADDMVELFGLRGRERRPVTLLSAGEQQRVAIARAFITEPALVIADEPTGSLDARTGIEILQLLWESCDNFGQTMVLVTHDARVAAFADKVLIIKDGSLVDELRLGRRQEHSDARPIIDRLQELDI